MKKLLILILGFLLGSFCFTKQPTNVDEGSEASSVCKLFSQSPDFSSDFVLVMEDDEEDEPVAFAPSFNENEYQFKDFISCHFTVNSQIGEQISPHHFTNLPPPYFHVILYS